MTMNLRQGIVTTSDIYIFMLCCEYFPNHNCGICGEGAQRRSSRAEVLGDLHLQTISRREQSLTLNAQQDLAQ